MFKLEEMSSAELRRVIDQGANTVVVAFGSVEQHGGHLPVGSDALLADFVGEAVAGRLNAVLAPTVRIGCSQHPVAGTGTLLLRAETLRQVTVDVATSLIVQGFGVIAVTSTHGGNQPALEEAARHLSEHHPEVTVLAPRGDLGPSPGARSGKWLTSVMLSIRPDLVEVEAADPDLLDEVRTASRDEGTRNLERFISAVVDVVADAAEQRARRTHPSSVYPRRPRPDGS
jgi:creatinine amidohydrolase